MVRRTASRVARAAILLLLAAPGRGARVVPGVGSVGPSALPREVVRKALSYVPGPPLLAWSKNGRAVNVQRLDEERARTVLSGHTNGTYSAKIFPGGDRVVTSGFDGASAIWELRTGKLLHVLRHADHVGKAIVDVQVFPDGGRLATLGVQGELVIWDAATGAAAQRLHTPSHRVVRVLAWGRLVSGVSPEQDAAPLVWDSSGRRLHQLRPPRGAVALLEASSCGEMVVTAGLGHAFVWRAAHGFMERELPSVPHSLRGLLVSRRAEEVVSSYAGGLVVWGLGGVRRAHQEPGRVFELLGLLCGGRVAALVDLAELVVWDPRTGELTLLDSGRDVPRFVAAGRGEVVAAIGSLRGAGGRIARVTAWHSSSGGVLLTSESRVGPIDDFVSLFVALGRAPSMAELVRA